MVRLGMVRLGMVRLGMVRLGMVCWRKGRRGLMNRSMMCGRMLCWGVRLLDLIVRLGVTRVMGGGAGTMGRGCLDLRHIGIAIGPIKQRMVCAAGTARIDRLGIGVRPLRMHSQGGNGMGLVPRENPERPVWRVKPLHCTQDCR